MPLTTTVRLALATLAFVPGCTMLQRDAGGRPPEAELLHGAMHALTGVMVYDILSPPQASRVYSYSTIAAYEVLRQHQPGYQSLAGQVTGLTPVPAPAPNVEYSMPVAGIHAFMTVGRALTFSRPRMDSLRRVMDERARTPGMSDAVYDRSIAYGDSVAKHILAWAARDRFLQTRGYAKYTVTTMPGRWTPTPPAYMDAVEPNWAVLRPFVMDTSSQFRPAGPPVFDTAAGSAYRAMIDDVVTVTSTLTAEQRAIAAFWDCNPYVMHVQGHAMYALKKISPGGHWMGIVALASRKAEADIVRSAEAYAHTALALSEGFLAAWDEKYRTNVIRPETVINSYVDERWVPLLQTPPFPEYPSGHSVISTAAAEVLTKLYGRDFAFADSSELEYGLPVRSFPSFEAAAAEAAMSRMYGGIHFRPAIEDGIGMGRRIGALVNERITTRADSAAGPRTMARAAAPSALAARP